MMTQLPAGRRGFPPGLHCPGFPARDILLHCPKHAPCPSRVRLPRAPPACASRMRRPHAPPACTHHPLARHGVRH